MRHPIDPKIDCVFIEFSEKERAYQAYQARQNFLRQQKSIAKRIEALTTEASRERAEKQRARAAEEQARSRHERPKSESADRRRRLLPRSNGCEPC